jgi:hypothetical protein
VIAAFLFNLQAVGIQCLFGGVLPTCVQDLFFFTKNKNETRNKPTTYILL